MIADRGAHGSRRAYLEDARSERVLTYGTLDRAVSAWTAVFDTIGVPASGAVLVDLGDPLSFAVVHLAAVASGRRAVPVDTGQPTTEPGRLGALLGGASLVVSDRDEDGATTGLDAEDLFSATAGLTITPFPTNDVLSGLKVRPEVRWDYASDSVFAGDNNQVTGAIEAYYAF